MLLAALANYTALLFRCLIIILYHSGTILISNSHLIPLPKSISLPRSRICVSMRREEESRIPNEAFPHLLDITEGRLSLTNEIGEVDGDVDVMLYRGRALECGGNAECYVAMFTLSGDMYRYI